MQAEIHYLAEKDFNIANARIRITHLNTVLIQEENTAKLVSDDLSKSLRAENLKRSDNGDSLNEQKKQKVVLKLYEQNWSPEEISLINQVDIWSISPTQTP